jgi:Kef-type K+ transport system membrane component KefB
MILGAIGAFLLIRSYGVALVAPPATAPQTVAEAPAPGADVFLHVLLALSAVVLTGLLLAKCFAYLGQPPVIGEVIAGIVLGPSFLGSEASALLLPPTVAPFLGVIAQLGVLLYMFTVGLELHTDLMRQRTHTTVAISHTSILVPFVLGALLALDLYPRLSSSDVPFTSFALFMGVAMSITAFPVLARILTDRRLIKTELGAIALSGVCSPWWSAWRRPRSAQASWWRPGLSPILS